MQGILGGKLWGYPTAWLRDGEGAAAVWRGACDGCGNNSCRNQSSSTVISANLLLEIIPGSSEGLFVSSQVESVSSRLQFPCFLDSGSFF